MAETEADQDMLKIVRGLTRKLQNSRDRTDELQRERDETVRRARLDGYRVRDLAHECDISRQAVEKILKAPFRNKDQFV